MPTLWSRSLIPTLRQVPSEAEVPSHQLMLRAGFIHKLGAGVYEYLPLGLRSLQKAMQIVREEMDKSGAVEVLLPALQPLELWERTGRRENYGDNLFVLKDRHSDRANLALGPTHEEVITSLVGSFISSYRQLPLTLYQIQTKFRDEYRPRFGVLRSREFQMKDAYSFHLTLEGPGGLNETYDTLYAAYCRIFERCGLPYRIVEAESGPIGGSASHEFMVPSPTGEDTILESDKGNYAANVEKCEIGPRQFSVSFGGTLPSAPPSGELTKVHTPNTPGIEDVAKFMKAKPKDMLKTLVCGEKGEWVIAVVRGDHELNEAKLRAAVGQKSLALADERAARDAGFAIGFVGPHVAVCRTDVTLVVDPDVALDKFWITGANEVDHHVKHFNWKRDVLDALTSRDREGAGLRVADIRNAMEGDPSPKNDGGVLRATKGIEIGHVFKLGTKYTDSLDVKVLGPDNALHPVIMGCYGIGVNRILASAIERKEPGKTGHDENGIIWPASIAPYRVVITPIKYEGDMKAAADRLAAELEAAGVDVLIDDRDERPGVKFKDADLIGIPIRITIGDKTLKDGQVEFKPRREPKATLVAVDAASRQVVEMLASL